MDTTLNNAIIERCKNENALESDKKILAGTTKYAKNIEKTNTRKALDGSKSLSKMLALGDSLIIFFEGIEASAFITKMSCN